MKTVLLIILAAVSLATSACTVTYDPNLRYSSYEGSHYPQTVYTRPYRSNYCPPQQYLVGPQYYRTPVPYFRGNIRNYTDAPIIAPSACNPHTNIIIPNSWN
jgi:hypothetical protein